MVRFMKVIWGEGESRQELRLDSHEKIAADVLRRDSSRSLPRVNEVALGFTRKVVHIYLWGRCPVYPGKLFDVCWL